MNQSTTNLLGMDRNRLANFFDEMGERSFRAGQVMQWIHQYGVTEFDAMTNLSKSLRQSLSVNAELRPPKVIKDQLSTDGTRKWLLQLDDGNSVETVFIPEAERGTLCISSQVGCSLNCTFCATGWNGFNRNLTTDEILSQVWIAHHLLGWPEGNQRIITNVVLMGMGEPLLNYDNVIPAIKLMLDDLGYGLSKRRVTLSTAGVIPGINKLKQDCNVSLALSLHAPNDELRSQLVPLNKKYPIKEVMQACRNYVSDQNRARVTLEYIMLDGINDSVSLARQLANIIGDMPAKVNLIPYNPISAVDYRRSPMNQINRFRDVLMENKIMTVTRKTRGDDIDAACGQLAGQFKDRTRRSEHAKHIVELQQ